MPHTIAIGTAVRCADGQAGDIGGLIINPNRNHVDYVILRHSTRAGREVFVQSGQIQRASARMLTLPCSWGDLEQLPHPDERAVQGSVLDNLSDLCVVRAETPVRDGEGNPLGHFHGAIVDDGLEVQAILLAEAPDSALPITQVARFSDNVDALVVTLVRTAAA
jgi:hypothetical protein